MVSAAILGFAGFTALAALLIVPAMIVWNAVRDPNIARFYSAMFLVLWACVSIVHAGVWFLIVVAAHSVNSSDLNFWIAANVIYPVVGAVFVWIHRWMVRRSPAG